MSEQNNFRNKIEKEIDFIIIKNTAKKVLCKIVLMVLCIVIFSFLHLYLSNDSYFLIFLFSFFQSIIIYNIAIYPKNARTK